MFELHPPLPKLLPTYFLNLIFTVKLSGAEKPETDDCGETTARYEGGDFWGRASPAMCKDEHIKCKLTLPASALGATQMWVSLSSEAAKPHLSERQGDSAQAQCHTTCWWFPDWGWLTQPAQCGHSTVCTDIILEGPGNYPCLLTWIIWTATTSNISGI